MTVVSALADAGFNQDAWPEQVRQGVEKAGGTALVFPTISLSEALVRPTTMFLRNLMSIDVEEMITASPIDGVVLLNGCDKTVVAQLMGALSANKPAVSLGAGIRPRGEWCGRPLTIGNAICVHEEDYGILWKHTDRRLPDAPEVRRSRRLVISSVSTVENYEYGFFWYFYQDGNIGFEIKLTGILSLGAVNPGEKPPFGNLVAPQVYAPNHQHFFNVRLDFDLDGTANTVQRIDVAADPLDAANPFENAFRATATALETEKAARAHLNLETARTWKIVNPHVFNAVGEPVGYKFLPGDNAFPFASPNAWWRKRAGFVNHHVWVTPFTEGEKYAAGDYPNQSQGGDGLVKWTEADRPIADTDVVFWYTFGHTHLPRPEDYPVMPTAYIGFLLKPNGFFDLNPANDVPPSAPKAETAKGCCH